MVDAQTYSQSQQHRQYLNGYIRGRLAFPPAFDINRSTPSNACKTVIVLVIAKPILFLILSRVFVAKRYFQIAGLLSIIIFILL